MPSILSERIAALRKERGLTQEQLGKLCGVSSQAVGKWEKGGAPDVELLPVLAQQLGVSIDALFGLESGDRLDVPEVVGGWLRGFPERERMARLCRLVLSLIYCFLPGNLEMPKLEYVKNCQVHYQGKTQLMYTRIRREGGSLLGVQAENMSFVTLWPEPKEGYTAYLAPMEDFRRLFGLLAKPGYLELIEELHRRKPQFFAPSVVAKQLDIPVDELIEKLEELESMSVLHSMKMELEDGEVKVCQLTEPINLVPLLYAAQSFMQTGINYTYFYDDEVPLLRGEKWKKQEDDSYEKNE